MGGCSVRALAAKSAGARFSRERGRCVQAGAPVPFPGGIGRQGRFRPASRGPAAPRKNRDGAASGGNLENLTQCRTIALELCDVAKIHQKLKTGLDCAPPARSRYVAPGTQMERELCELWQKLLRVERVGIEDDFFELGGHSLLAVRLFAEMEKMTGRKLPLVTLFQAPTIGQLAALLRRDQASASAVCAGADSAARHQTAALPRSRRRRRRALGLCESGGAHGPGTAHLCASNRAGKSAWRNLSELEDMAAFYLQAVRSTSPKALIISAAIVSAATSPMKWRASLQVDGGQVALLALA